MVFLINATNLGGGGGIQVADSICRYLNKYPQHKFVCVLSDKFEKTATAIAHYENVVIERYNYPSRDLRSLLTMRNKRLDQLVELYHVDCVLTVFGPMKWKPRCAHVCGFAMSQIVLSDSPFFTRMSMRQRIKAKAQIKLWKIIFRRSSKCFYTENELITKLVERKFKGSEVHTITNNYNQVFERPDEWQNLPLPEFDGIRLLGVTSTGGHKNIGISLEIARILQRDHPNFKFRFVFTVEKGQFPAIPADLEPCFYFTGKVDVAACPSLYSQCDFEFQSTLLECFTATYPEAMVMKKPIITTDLEFARGLCGDAAVYYSALSPQSAADAIYRLSQDKLLQETLVDKGLEQLKKFDTSEQRADKLIKLCETYCRK